MELVKTKDGILEYINFYWPKIAVFFATTYGLPFEFFKEEFEKKTLGEQLLFIIDQVKKGYYSKL